MTQQAPSQNRRPGRIHPSQHSILYSLFKCHVCSRFLWFHVGSVFMPIFLVFLVWFSYWFCLHGSFVFMSALFSCRLGIYYLLHVLQKYASTLVTAGRRESRPYHPRAHTRVDCKSAVLPSNPEGVARGKRTWTTALNTGQQSGSRTSCRSGDGATPTQFDVTQSTHNVRWSASDRWRLDPELHLQSSTKKRTS